MSSIGTRYVSGYQTVFVNGVPSPGALVNFYVTGSSTRAATYSDSGLTVPNSNPVVADSNGLLPNIFLDPAVTYKVVTTDQNGANQTTADPVSSNTAAIAAGLGLGTASTYDIGTSGATVPLLNGTQSWGGTNTFAGPVILGATQKVAIPGGATPNVGYLELAQLYKAANYTTIAGDSGCDIIFSVTGTVATIASNATVPYPLGTIISFTWGPTLNGTVAIATDTLRWPVGNVTGPRTVTGPGFLVAIKKFATEWWVCGGVNIG